MKLLEGKTVVVTGASTGIGRAIAIGAAQHGADVAINFARDTDGAAQCIAGSKRPASAASAIQGDVADPATATDFIAQAVQAFGKVDVMVSNAGICPFHSFLDMPVETFERTMRVNLHGGYYMCQAAARQMVDQGHGGSIIAVSSISALVGGEFQTHYTPTKAGLHSLMQSAAIALGRPQYSLQFAAARHHPDRDQQGRPRRRGQAHIYGRARAAWSAGRAGGYGGARRFPRVRPGALRHRRGVAGRWRRLREPAIGATLPHHHAACARRPSSHRGFGDVRGAWSALPPCLAADRRYPAFYRSTAPHAPGK